MGAVSVVSCVSVLWVLIGVGGAMGSPRAEESELQRSFKDDTDDLQLFPASQQSTESLSSWPLFEGSPPAAASTRPLTGLPWSSALSATPSILLDEMHSLPAPGNPLLHYLVPDSLAPSASFTSAPHVLPLPLSLLQQPPPSGVTKGSGSFEKEFVVRPIQPPFPFVRTLKNIELINDSSKEDYSKETQMKNNVGVSQRDSQSNVVPSASLQHSRMGPAAYEVPVAVQSYGPTSHFFLHELLEPKHQSTHTLDTDAKLYSLNTYELPSSSRPIVFPSPITTTPSAPIMFPDVSPSPSTVPDNFISTIPDNLPSSISRPTEAPNRQNLTVTTPDPPDAGPTENRVIISVPCHGRCQVSAGRICVTDFSCRGHLPVK